MLSSEQAIEIMDSLNAVKLGHFIGKSGGHLSAYVQKEVPTRYPRQLRILAAGLARKLRDAAVDIVVAPPMGALSLGTMVAEDLGVEYAYLEEVDGLLQVKRLPFIEGVTGRRVGLVEDIVTDGGTIRRSLQAVAAAGGETLWSACLWNRGGQTAESIGSPMFVPLVDRQLEEWQDGDCQLCRQGVPINLKPGHGHEYQNSHPDYPGGYI